MDERLEKIQAVIPSSDEEGNYGWIESVDFVVKVKEMLQGLLFWYVQRVTCDETNNTPEVVDNNQMIARLEWKGVDGIIRYIDLVFGDVEIVWEDEIKTMPDHDPQTGETNPYYLSWKEEVEKVVGTLDLAPEASDDKRRPPPIH